MGSCGLNGKQSALSTGLGCGLRAVLLDSELGARFSGLASLQDGRVNELMR